MRIKIAVCDGDKEVCRYIAQIIARQKPEVLVKTFYTAETLLQDRDDFDIYFLDIKDVGRDFDRSIFQAQCGFDWLAYSLYGRQSYLELGAGLRPYQRNQCLRQFFASSAHHLRYCHENLSAGRPCSREGLP